MRVRSSAGRRRWAPILAVDLHAVDSGDGARWRPEVTYSYAVNGRVMTAGRITPGKAPSIKDEIEARDYVGPVSAADADRSPLQPGRDHRIGAGACYPAQRLPEPCAGGRPRLSGPGAVHADRHARLAPARLAVLAAAVALQPDAADPEPGGDRSTGRPARCACPHSRPAPKRWPARRTRLRTSAGQANLATSFIVRPPQGATVVVLLYIG